MKVQLQYEFDKKEDSLKYQHDLTSENLKKQKQTKNYLIAGITLFAILSFFIYRNYRNRQRLKLQTLRNKIARDLHDDVGSTLSSISIFSEMAKQQSKEVIPMLDTIGESSRKMLDAMADIVWTIEPENDQFEKIILRMKNFAYELLGAKKIDFEFEADDEVAKMKLPMEVRKNLYLIFKEATNNMVKYSTANKAMFAIKGEKNNLIMTIHDDGKGFDVNKSTEGNGLKNMKKRATEIGADLLIDSHPGNGTTIQLRVAV
jgi:signal transduction histidine kinase